jgi:predicted DNA-binding protein (MmcQ/YjbR family)
MSAPARGDFKSESPSDRLRAICLALPEAAEVVIKRGPTYRINEKIFALDRLVKGRASAWFKAPAGAQGVLIGADPERFFSPPYYGSKGWIGMRLDRRPDWSEVVSLAKRSYCLIAPRRLSATLSLT